MNKINYHHLGRRGFLAGAVASLGIGWRGFGALAEAHNGHPAHATDSPARHGMLLFGEKKVYLSHLPLFHSPHNYQVILEVTLTKANSDPQASYVQDRRQHPKVKIYTVNPESFVLPELDPQNPQRRSFKAELFRGHFERPGNVSLNRDVTVNVTRVIHFRKFDPQAAGLPQLEYFLFGQPQELFLAHLVTKPPDFDQVLSVARTSRNLTPEELGGGLAVIFPGKANQSAQKIVAKRRVSGQIKQAGGNSGVGISLGLGEEIYFEAGELAA